MPSFAIGRTQEVVWELDRLIERGEIPLLPLYLDSPMASKASDIYRRHPRVLRRGDRASCCSRGARRSTTRTRSSRTTSRQSQAIERAPRPYMIVASNGMLTGGRVVGHLRNLIDDPTATILFVGYQGEGTLGAHLQAGRDDGPARRPARARSAARSARSAASRPTPTSRELLDWLRRLRPRASGPAIPATRGGSSSSTATPTPRSRWSRRSARSASRRHVPHWHERVELD